MQHAAAMRGVRVATHLRLSGNSRVIILHNSHEILFNWESALASAVAHFVYSMFDTSRYREVEEKVHNVAWIFVSALR